MAFGFGVDEANVYFLGSKKTTHGVLFANILLVSLGGAVVCCILALAMRQYLLATVLKNIRPAYFYFSVLAIPFLLFNRLSTTIFQGHRDFVSFNLANVSSSLSSLGFCILLIVIVGMGVSGGALSVPMAAAAVSLLLLVLLVKRDKPARRPDFSVLKGSLLYGIRAQPGVLMNFFNRRLDLFVINFFLTASDVGLYVVGVALAELLWNLPNAVGLTLFPKIASSGEDEGREFTCKVARNLIFAMVVGGGILALLGRPLLLIFFGREFLPSLAPFVVLLPGVVFLGVAKVMSSNFHGRGKPQYGTYITIFSVTLTITLDLLLIPRMGIIGAAFASTVAYAGAGILSVLWFVKQSGASMNEVLIVRWNEIQRYPALATSVLRK